MGGCLHRAYIPERSFGYLISLTICRSSSLSFSLRMCLSVCQSSVSVHVCLSVSCPSFCLSVYPSFCLSVCLSTCLPVIFLLPFLSPSLSRPHHSLTSCIARGIAFSYTLNPKSQAQRPQPQTLNPKSNTIHPNPQTTSNPHPTQEAAASPQASRLATH